MTDLIEPYQPSRMLYSGLMMNVTLDFTAHYAYFGAASGSHRWFGMITQASLSGGDRGTAHSACVPPPWYPERHYLGPGFEVCGHSALPSEHQ